MNDMIGGYHCLTPMQTTGSGSARWCFAEQGGNRFFLKEFLTPVYPVRTDTPLGQRQLERCVLFEKKKQQLYHAMSCVIGNTLVPVLDFFRSDGRYYAVSEAAPENHLTGVQAAGLSEEQKRKILCDLALCLQRMHIQGLVHADLKPEHIIVIPDGNDILTQLIDVDSGFLMDHPPQREQEIEGDPVYLAPEMFLRMTGEPVELGSPLDVFAFGALIVQIWTGALPEFDQKKYHYLYEAVLDGGDIKLNLPEDWEPVVRRMLCADPSKRPSDAEIVFRFLKPQEDLRQQPVRNSLKQLMKV